MVDVSDIFFEPGKDTAVSVVFLKLLASGYILVARLHSCSGLDLRAEIMSRNF